MRILLATSELFPLIKTGGLGDVSASLPNALVALGNDVRVVLPAYRSVLQDLDGLRMLGWLPLSGGREVRIVEAHHAELAFPVWLIDAPDLFDRGGLPYTDAEGRDWPDNAERFTVLSECSALLATDALDLDWQADVVHANDWQTGLLPAFLSMRAAPPRTLFTVHNLAYDCQVDLATFQRLGLPDHWWSIDTGEFYGRLSMLKCGLVFSDLITTVSPRYAEEIRTAEYGYGYASILDEQADKLVGVLNGIDDATWNPQTDPHLVAHYDASSAAIREGKRANREALLGALGASAEAIAHTGPLIGTVGRLVYQKGVDLLLDVMPGLIAEDDAQFVMVGTGERELEQRLNELALRYPDRVFRHLGYSERLAHLLEAGCDIFAMPSRYEPCGLNQMYSLRYGTPPVVRATGGLADTVEDTSPRSLAREEANGFVFEEPTAEALRDALKRAIELHRQPKQWIKLVKIGMHADNGWTRRAEQYLQLYGSNPEEMSHG